MKHFTFLAMASLIFLASSCPKLDLKPSHEEDRLVGTAWEAQFFNPNSAVQPVYTIEFAEDKAVSITRYDSNGLPLEEAVTGSFGFSGNDVVFFIPTFELADWHYKLSHGTIDGEKMTIIYWQHSLDTFDGISSEDIEFTLTKGTVK